MDGIDDAPQWREGVAGGHYLFWRSFEIARVAPTADGSRWMAHIGLHRRDHRKHHVAFRASQEAARSTCFAWWSRHHTGIAAELPRMVPATIGRRLEYPACNPPGPTS